MWNIGAIPIVTVSNFQNLTAGTQKGIAGAGDRRGVERWDEAPSLADNREAGRIRQERYLIVATESLINVKDLDRLTGRDIASMSAPRSPSPTKRAVWRRRLPIPQIARGLRAHPIALRDHKPNIVMSIGPR